MDEKTIQRIKKLQALAERGVGGEKTTAQKKLAKLLSPCCGAAQGYKKFVTAYTGKER